MKLSRYFRSLVAVLALSLLLGAFSTNALATSISNDRFFAWAEAMFPDVFSGTATTAEYLQYNYRLYGGGTTLLAVDTSGMVYILGPITGNTLSPICYVTDLESTITAWEATHAAPDTTAWQSAYNTCYVGTPALYTNVYCAAYADAIVAGSSPGVANIAGADAAGSNIGNIGMGGTITATGTPLTGSGDTTQTPTCTAPQVLQNGVCITPTPNTGGTGDGEITFSKPVGIHGCANGLPLTMATTLYFQSSDTMFSSLGTRVINGYHIADFMLRPIWPSVDESIAAFHISASYSNSDDALILNNVQFDTAFSCGYAKGYFLKKLNRDESISYCFLTPPRYGYNSTNTPMCSDLGVTFVSSTGTLSFANTQLIDGYRELMTVNGTLRFTPF
ncbi:MAG: hypothetical protein WC256_02090 [Desulfurivibrionaceae bacterium]|jgi:hypothetical protein